MDITPERSDIVVRNYSSNDYDEIMKSGYIFSLSFLNPSLFVKILKRLGWTDLFTLVAYHRIKRNVAGVITYVKYTDKIWITGPLFVSPNFRGMGIGSLLVTTANQVLKDNGIGKAFGDVPKGNPVIKLHTRLGMKMLTPMLHAWGTLHMPPKLEELPRCVDVKEAEVYDIPQLFKIYQQNVTSFWISFFDINKDNFLIEYSRNIRMVPKLLKYRKTIVAKINGKICGYSLIVLPRFTLFGKIKSSEIDIFVSPDHREEVVKTLVIESLKELHNHNITNVLLYLMSSGNDFTDIEEFLDCLNLNHLIHYCMAYFI